MVFNLTAKEVASLTSFFTSITEKCTSDPKRVEACRKDFTEIFTTALVAQQVEIKVEKNGDFTIYASEEFVSKFMILSGELFGDIAAHMYAIYKLASGDKAQAIETLVERACETNEQKAEREKAEESHKQAEEALKKIISEKIKNAPTLKIEDLDNF